MSANYDCKQTTSGAFLFLLAGPVNKQSVIISYHCVLKESSLYLSFFPQNEISEVAEK